MLKKITLFNLIMLGLSLSMFGQKPEADLIYTQVVPVIDGQVDVFWESIEAHNIDKEFQSETPTLLSATWKAAWNNDGIYVLVEVSDDIWMPSWVSGNPDWASDKVELYFDTSIPLVDGMGAQNQAGNWQAAGNFTEVDMGSEQTITDMGQAIGAVHADTYDGSGNYVKEYFVPFSSIPDSYDEIIDPTVRTQIGFDVTVVDLDDMISSRQRTVWANIGFENESWITMDSIGLINFTYGDLKPIAIAGEDFQIWESEVLALDGSASFDHNGDPLSYGWVSLEGLEISNSTVAQPSVIFPDVTVNTDYSFVLTVFDGTFYSQPDTVVVTVLKENQYPVADAGTDQSVDPLETVVLDGSGSYDLDGDALNLSWVSLDGIELSDSTTVSPVFVAPDVDETTNFVFVLQVNDGEDFSAPDSVVITVVKVASGIQTNNTINSLNIAPNPASNFASIIFESENSGVVTIQVITSDGKTIEQKTVDSNIGANELTIDVSDYANGMYIVLVNNGTSVQKEKMLIVK